MMMDCKFPCAGGGTNPLKLPEFTYTGQSQTLIDGGKGWRIKFLTSGTFTLINPKQLNIDVFLVGGGGGGGNSFYNNRGPSRHGGGGGGGGYTLTSKNLIITNSRPIVITIGAGGNSNINGSLSKFDTLSVNGGYKGNNGSWDDITPFGGNGGCGGNGGGQNCSSSVSPIYTGVGGSDGSDGTDPHNWGWYGIGQHTTTREFGESEGTDYSGGGGGGSAMYNESASGSFGGAGGGSGGGIAINNNRYGLDGSCNSIGGKGGETVSKVIASGGSGGGNYGAGGGGAGASQDYNAQGGAGAQGIVIIRNHREVAV